MPIRLEMVVVWSVVGERTQNSAKKAENVELKLELSLDTLGNIRIGPRLRTILAP